MSDKPYQERYFIGPGAINVTMRWCSRRGGWKRYPTWRERVVWWLRQKADRIEIPSRDHKPQTYSFTLDGTLPAWVDGEIHADAMAYGISHAMDYLDELAEEMSVK